MVNFPNISEIFDFLVANLGVPDKSMISERFPHAKPFDNKKLFPENLFPEKVFPAIEKNCSGEKNLGGNGGEVSVVSGFPRFVQISGFLGEFSFLDISEMMDFPSTPEILDFFVEYL